MSTAISKKAKKIPITDPKVKITTKAVDAVNKRGEAIKNYLEFEQQMVARYEALGGAQFFGSLEQKKGDVWYYQKGCLCYRKDKKIYEIHGEIYKKWKELHGPAWGIPDTDELPCEDGTGRFNMFNGGSAYIFWSPKTGAHGVWGDICRRWVELGLERSYLGYPLSSEVDFQDGKVNAFEHGGIYWWADTGAIDANEVAVQYTGLACFGETTEASASDEPYVIVGTVDKDRGEGKRSQVYEGVDAGDTRGDLMEVYRGKPNGVALAVFLMENDEDNPDKYKDQVKLAMETAHSIGTAALTTIPVVGVGIAAVAGPIIQHYIPKIADEVNKLLGTEDDQIGYEVIPLTGKQMLQMAKQQDNSTFKEIGYKFTTNDLRGDGAHYKVYFGVTAV